MFYHEFAFIMLFRIQTLILDKIYKKVTNIKFYLYFALLRKYVDDLKLQVFEYVEIYNDRKL